MGQYPPFEIFIIILIACNGVFADAKLTEELVQFSRSNGIQAVNLVTVQKELMRKEILEIMKCLQENQIQVKVLSISDLVTVPFNVLKEDFVFSELTELQDWLNLLPLLSHIQVRSAIVISSWDFRNKQIPTNSLNLHVFLLQRTDFSWFEVIGVNKTHFGITREMDMVRVNKLAGVRRLHLDFQNITLTCFELDFEPFALLSNCKNDISNCEPSGINGMLALEMEQVLNLRIKFNKEPTNGWGIMSGDENLSSSNLSWTGVMGRVISGQSQLSISLWIMYAHRIEVADMALMDSSVPVVVFSPRPPDTDLGLFLRPFTLDAWKVTLATIFLIVVSTKISLFVNHGNAHACSYRLTYASGIFLWLLLNAFYSGALTMFFANDLPKPFNSIEEAINAYPEWNLIMAKGSEVYYKPYISTSKAYAEFWHRVETKPQETVVKDDLEGLNEVASKQAILQLQKDIFLYMVNNKKLPAQDITVALKSQFMSHRAFMLTNNSPLTEAFSYCLLDFRQRGITDRLKRKWEGPTLRKQKLESASTMVLSLGQLILPFLLMAAAVAVAVFGVIAEILFRRWSKRSRHTYIINGNNSI